MRDPRSDRTIWLDETLRVLTALEAELAALDRLAIPIAAAHLDAAIANLRQARAQGCYRG